MESTDAFIPYKNCSQFSHTWHSLAGCATSTLIQKDNRSHTRDVKTSLVDDQVVAFGKLAQVQNHLPADSLVIAGYKNSYVLTQGGAQFVRLINKLDAKNIQMTKELTFYSEKMMVISQVRFLCLMSNYRKILIKKILNFILKMAQRNVQLQVISA